MRKFQLSIPEPCSESWAAMTPNEKGRFCNSCNKTVIDFSSMSNQQLALYFKKYRGHVCGRLTSYQLGSELVLPKTRIPWLRYFFQITIPAFLLSLKAGAQQKTVSPATVVIPATIIRAAKAAVPDTVAVSSQVLDKSGNPVPFATVHIPGTSMAVAAGEDGRFTINAPGYAILEISSVGYVQGYLAVKDWEPGRIVVLRNSETLIYGGAVVIATVTKGKKNRERIPILHQVMDSIGQKIGLYPNPAVSGSSINVDLKKLGKGDYTIFLLDMTGRLVIRQNVIVDAAASNFVLPLKDVTAATYVLRVMNRKSAKEYSRKLVVQ